MMAHLLMDLNLKLLEIPSITDSTYMVHTPNDGPNTKCYRIGEFIANPSQKEYLTKYGQPRESKNDEIFIPIGEHDQKTHRTDDGCTVDVVYEI